MNWLLYTLGSIILFTAINLLQKVVADESQFYRATTFLFNFFATFFTVCIFLVTNHNLSFQLPTSYQAWGVLMIGGLFYGLFERGRYHVARLLDASVLSTILTLAVLIAFLGSSLLYHEAMTTPKLIGAALILISLVLVSYQADHAQSVSKKGLTIGVLLSIALGLGWMLDKMGAAYFTPNIYSLLIWPAGLLVTLFPSLELAKIKAELARSGKSLVLVAGLNAAGYWLQLQALSIAEATKIIPLVQTTTLLTAVTGILFLQERDNMVRKILAAVLALAGTYFLVSGASFTAIQGVV